MERSVVILGLSRQTKFMGLPLPYAMGVMFLTMLPFIWFKIVAWVFTAPLWYLAARLVTKVNPTAHVAFQTMIAKTPKRFMNWVLRRNQGTRYV